MKKYEKPSISLITLSSANNIAASDSTCIGDWTVSVAKNTPGGCYEYDFSISSPATCWMGSPTGV